MRDLSSQTKVVISDIDYWLVCLWKSVMECPNELIDKIRSAQLSPSLFLEYRKQDGDSSIDPCEAGFRKLLMHQMSFSGLGAKAGGPIGGSNQSNAKYSIEARWNPVEQIAKVRERHRLLHKYRAHIHTLDFEVAIKETDSTNTLFYLDPPYVQKGEVLYVHPFTPNDHARLARYLKTLTGKFVLSYDDDPTVRELYRDYKIINASAIYSICTSRKNNELIITNF